MKIAMDELLLQLGDPGRVQVFVYVLLGLNYFPIVTNHLVMAVYGSKVPFHCDLHPQSTSSNGLYTANGSTNGLYAVNNSSQSEFTCAIPERDSLGQLTNQTVPCITGWIFDTKEKTIVTEWSLVCENKNLVALSTTLYFCGVMLGGLIFGFLSDRFGRKPFILFTLYAQIAVGIGIFFAPTYVVFTSLRVIQGALMQGLQTTSYAMVMELFRPLHRSVVGAATEVFWGTSVVLLAMIWYLVQDWRYIQLIISLPFVLAISYVWLLPESLRWLLLKGKFAEADKFIDTIVKYNKIPYPTEILKRVKAQIKSLEGVSQTRFTVIDLFKTPNIRKRSLILFYIWFATALGYYGLSLSTTQIAGNKFLLFFISGAVELPAYIASIFVLKRFGRRRPMTFFFLMCGATCIGAGLIRSDDPGLQKLSQALALAGKFCTAGLFSVVFLYAAELYPTVIRNVGCGACAFWMRAGGVAAPQILRLGVVGFSQLPFLIFGGVALVGGVLTLLLPETLNRQLPDKIQDVEGDVNGDVEMDQIKTRSTRDDQNVPLKLAEEDPSQEKL